MEGRREKWKRKNNKDSQGRKKTKRNQKTKEEIDTSTFKLGAFGTISFETSKSNFLIDLMSSLLQGKKLNLNSFMFSLFKLNSTFVPKILKRISSRKYVVEFEGVKSCCFRTVSASTVLNESRFLQGYWH